MASVPALVKLVGGYHAIIDLICSGKEDFVARMAASIATFAPAENPPIETLSRSYIFGPEDTYDKTAMASSIAAGKGCFGALA